MSDTPLPFRSTAARAVEAENNSPAARQIAELARQKMRDLFMGGDGLERRVLGVSTRLEGAAEERTWRARLHNALRGTMGVLIAGEYVCGLRLEQKPFRCECLKGEIHSVWGTIKGRVIPTGPCP